jgi:hypothetical protein
VAYPQASTSCTSLLDLDTALAQDGALFESPTEMWWAWRSMLCLR